MGGVGFRIDLVTAPEGEPARSALLRSTWEIIARRIDALAKRKGTRDITGFYLRMQASDGMRDGSWFVSGREMVFTSSDAAGLCYGEMEASRHWTELATLEMSEAIAEQAKQHGAALKKPERTLEHHQLARLRVDDWLDAL